MASGLPRYWHIVGLYHAGKGDIGTDKVLSPTDDQVANADAIIVRYKTPKGPAVYRTIHGADSVKGVGQVITTVTKVASPPRKRSR